MSSFPRRAEMHFKIDENLHKEVHELLRDNGHDAVTVYDQQLRGHADEEIAAVCKREERVIVTQDLDFSNIVAYPPRRLSGHHRLSPSRPESALHPRCDAPVASATGDTVLVGVSVDG